MTTLDGLNKRFSDAPWLHNCDIVLVGLGAVGHGVGLSLLANGYDVTAFDNDKVSVENVLPQGYAVCQIGLSKAVAFNENAEMFIKQNAVVYDMLYDDTVAEVMISAADSMTARKQVFNAFLSSDEAKLFIDARMIPSQFQVFCITKDDEKIAEYQKSLFNDNEITAQNCSFKSSRHTNQIIHGFVTSMVCNYVVNRENKIDIYDLPVVSLINTNYLGLCHFQ